MEDNEDEPVDVRAATPVLDEVIKGEIDEESSKPRQSYNLKPTKPHKCQDKIKPTKKIVKTKEECCDKKWKNRIETKRKKTTKVLIYEKPCTLPRLDVVPRHCLSKNEWIDMLARPSRKCPSPNKIIKTEERPLRPVSARMNQLALPPINRMLATLQDRGTILPPELVDKLIQVLEAKSCLSPEQAENLFHSKNEKKKSKIQRETSDKKFNCKETNLKNPGDEFFLKPSGAFSPEFDEKAVNCQYSMAMEFVKSILQWKSEIPQEEFQDISNIIVKRLENILEYQLVDSGDRMSQQMKFLSDIVASWIAGVLFEVAESQKEELEKECDEKRRGKTGSSSEDSDDDDDDDDDSEKEIVLTPRPELLAKLKKEKEPKKEKEESKGQIGDSYTKMKIKREEKSDDDEDGDGVVKGGNRSPGQTPPQNDTAGESPQASEEKMSTNEKEGEGETENLLSPKEVKSENMSRASRNRVGFVGVPDEEAEGTKAVLGESDSIQEIPQEPKIYETITIDDDGDDEPPFDSGGRVKFEEGQDEPVREGVKIKMEEPIVPKIKSEKIEDLSETVQIKKEPLDFQVSSEKNEDLGEAVVVNKGPDLEEPLLSQFKSEKNGKGLEIKQEMNSEKSDETDPLTRTIKEEPGIEEVLPVSQMKSEKIVEPEMSFVQEIKPDPELSGALEGNVKTEKIEEGSEDGLARVEIEPGILKLSEVKIKTEKVEGDLIKKAEKTEGKFIHLPVGEVKAGTVEKKLEELIEGSEMVEKPGEVSKIKFEKSREFEPKPLNLPTDKVKAETIDEKLKDSQKSGDKLFKKSRIPRTKSGKSGNLGLDKPFLNMNKDKNKIPLFPEELLSKKQDGDKLQTMADLEKILKTDIWSTELQKVVNETNEISKNPTIRDDSNEWRKSFQTSALNFHKFHVGSLHQTQHNRIMLPEQQVVKTGKLNYPDYENTPIIVNSIKTTN